MKHIKRRIVMVKVINLTKTFDGFCALDRAVINVGKGSVYGLVGPNGAGKTTVIKHITGVFRPDSGVVKIAGENVYENTDIKSKMIYISDELYFPPAYTIKDGAALYKQIYPKWDDNRFLKLRDIFKIDIKRKIRRLSKGMQKQVAFWLGLCTLPDVMILDEPVDGLDPVMRRNVWNLILQDVADREMTVLVSSHNLRELEDVCDHVGIMHQGKVVIEKSLDDVKGNIHKIQVAFSGGIPNSLLDKINIINNEAFGSVNMLIVKGELDEIKSRIDEYSPIISDVLPLSLEEVFVYELGGMGYELGKIIL